MLIILRSIARQTPVIAAKSRQGRRSGGTIYELAQRREDDAQEGFALERMQQAGMKVATVATGGDPSHAPARRAYHKAGFDVEIPSVWMCKLLSRTDGA